MSKCLPFKFICLSFYMSSLSSGILIHLGPPRPLDNSLDSISRTSIPASFNIWFVTWFLSYTMTLPGAIANVFAPSFHCSRTLVILSFPPHRMSVTGRFKCFSRTASSEVMTLLIVNRDSVFQFQKQLIYFQYLDES